MPLPFFVQWIEGQHRFDHLVTAEHVISGLITKGHDIWIRVNVVDGQTKELHLKDTTVFRFHPNAERDPTDVAVSPISTTFVDDDTGNTLKMDVIPFVLNDPQRGSYADPQFASEFIVLGGEIAIVGLFRGHFGANRNVPIVRVGNIAALLSEPVFTAYAGYMKAYLVEARSIAGLSGSPVLVLPDSAVLMAKTLVGEKTVGSALLGPVHGHFDVPRLNEDVVTDEIQPERSVHTGIGVVIPTEKIVETIQHPELVAMRKAVIANLREKGATADVVADDKAVPPHPTRTPLT